MNKNHHTSLRESWAIQKRVIYALLMREIITRYGRRNLGFLWLFLEPMLVTVLMVALWKFARADQYSTLNIAAFTITGYPMAMMWRNASNRAIGAISSNAALLYHRNVRALDTIFARMILEIAGATIAQLVIMAILIAVGWIDMPADPFYMLMAWICMAIFAMGLGLIICAISLSFNIFGKLWNILSFVVLPLSGAFFLVHTLPPNLQELALMMPMIHGTEMFRNGYFGAQIITHESIAFILTSDLFLLFIGLLLIKPFRNGIEQE